MITITSPRSASMENRRGPGFAKLAGVADFLACNNSKDEGMKGLIVPHLAEKCQSKIVAELAACISSQKPDKFPLTSASALGSE